MKIKKTYIYIILIVILITGGLYYYKQSQTKETKNEQKTEKGNEEILWLVDKNSYLYYPLKRGDVKFNRQDYAQTETLSIHKIIYKSKGGNIYGLLAIPKSISFM